MNLDFNKRFPNQNAEHRPWECTQETVADIIGNINRQTFTPGFGYGATFHLGNLKPADAGLSSELSFQAQCVYGSLPVADEDFDALSTSEIYEADFAHYSKDDKQLAQYFAMKGYKKLWSYDQIVEYMNQTGWGVGISVKWYESFDVPNQDGTLPAPQGDFTYHMGAVYGDETFGLRGKWWLGPQYGVGGYSFMSRTTCNLVSQWPALGFDPDAVRFWTLAIAGFTHWNAAGEIVPLLKSAMIKKS